MVRKISNKRRLLFQTKLLMGKLYHQILWTINQPKSTNSLYFWYESRWNQRVSIFMSQNQTVTKSVHRKGLIREKLFNLKSCKRRSVYMYSKTEIWMYLSHDDASVKSSKPSSWENIEGPFILTNQPIRIFMCNKKALWIGIECLLRTIESWTCLIPHSFWI